MSKNTRNRILLTAVAALLLVVMAVGGTVAYLQAASSTVTNTFNPANIAIKLEETMNTDSDNDQVNDKWTMQLIPSTSEEKDPKVTVTTSVKAYVFVQFTCTDEKGNAIAEDSSSLNYDFLLNNYTGDTKDSHGYTWTQGDGTDVPANVWYTIVDPKTDGNYEWALLANNTVSVPAAAGASDVNKTITMNFQAWAVQFAYGETNFTPAQAWDVAPDNTLTAN